MTEIRCPICPRHCALSEGQLGFCKARICQNGSIKSLNYGKITSIALDPIEKKPLYHFHPGNFILSVGSFGCNLRCPFCQNYQLSMSGIWDLPYQIIRPQELVDLAKKMTAEPKGNLGVAFTYNEPFISWEYVYDCSVLLHKEGLKSVLVTNGQVAQEPLKELLPYIDALNIDLKGFSQDFYNYIQGSFKYVKDTITTAAQKSHVELTTLIIPQRNDSVEMMEKEAEWIASISPDIPLHISRFFPNYKETSLPATPLETIDTLYDVAKKYLKYVYKGNYPKQ